MTKPVSTVPMPRLVSILGSTLLGALVASEAVAAEAVPDLVFSVDSSVNFSVGGDNAPTGNDALLLFLSEKAKSQIEVSGLRCLKKDEVSETSLVLSKKPPSKRFEARLEVRREGLPVSNVAFRLGRTFRSIDLFHTFHIRGGRGVVTRLDIWDDWKDTPAREGKVEWAIRLDDLELPPTTVAQPNDTGRENPYACGAATRSGA